MSAFDNNKNVMDYPYMFDNNANAAEELQFADKIKLMNNKTKPSKVGAPLIAAQSGDALSSILIQTFVEMMQVEGDLEKRRRELAMR